MSIFHRPSSDPRTAPPGSQAPVRSTPPPEPVAVPKASGGRDRIAPSSVPNRRRRWLTRAGVAVLLLAALVVATTQIILWTNVPRAIVLSKLQSQLGLRIHAGSLSAGWFGASLRDVRISLPLAEQSVVEVPEMRVRYNWLPSMLVMGPDLKSVELDRAVLDLRQSADGRWNIAEVMDLLGRSGGKQSATASGGGSSPPRLPKLVIADATVNIAAAGGKEGQISHVNVSGEADPAPLVWKYNASIDGVASLVGKVAPGGVWAHEVMLNIKPQAADLLRPWVANVPAFELVNGKWTGQLAGGGLSGRLDLGLLKVDGVSASGALSASSENGTIRVRPVNLALETGNSLASRVVATGGALSFDGKDITASSLQATVAGGQVRIDGSVDTAVSGGKLSALWEGLTFSPGAAVGGPRTSGALQASFATRLGGRPEIRAALDTRGWLSATQNWDGKLQINGDGSSWQNIDWQVAASSLALTGQQVVTLNGLRVALQSRGAEWMLTNISLPGSAASRGGDLAFHGAVASADSGQAVSEILAAGGAGTAPLISAKSNGPAAAAQAARATTGSTVLRSLDGSGDFNFATQVWWFKLSGQGWAVPQIEDETLAFNIDAQGNRDLLKLNDVSFYISGAVARLTGTYVYADPAPIHMVLDLIHQQGAAQKKGLQAERIRAVAAVTGVAPQKAPEPDMINGDIDGTVSLTGKMKDGLELKIKGKLTGRNVRIRGSKIGDFDGVIDGSANDNLAKVYTDKFDLLGAKWGLNAFYQLDKSAMTIGLSVDNLRLQDPSVRTLLHRDDLAGNFSGQWNIYMPGIKSRSERLRGTGWLSGSNLQAPNFAASDFHANFLLQDGSLTIDPIEFRRPAIEAAGDVVASAFEKLISGTPTTARTSDIAPSAVSAGKNGLHPDSAAQTAASRDADGEIRLGISLNLADRDHITVSKLKFVHWPVPLGIAAALSVDGGSDSIIIDLPDDAASTGSPRGLLHVRSPSVVATASILAVLANGKAGRIGDCDVDVQLEDRVADVRDLQMNLLGASLNANASIDLDHPLLASARVWVQNVDFKQIAQVVPAAQRVEGEYDLSVSIAPAQSPNALEPLQIDALLHSRGARVGGMQLGDGRLRAYANVDPNWGLVRLVSSDFVSGAAADKNFNQCPPVRDDPAVPDQNTIEMAGGMMRVWTRFVRNENEAGIKGATSLSSYIWMNFRCLDLNQLAHIADVQSPTMPGKLDGAIDLYGTTGISMPGGAGVPPGTDRLAQTATTKPSAKAPQDPFLVRLGRSLYGDGTVKLTNADIGNFAPIAFLYGAMHIGNDKRGPTGTGDVTFRIEGGAMDITALHYFNRGVEVRAQARVNDLAIMPDCPLTGTAVGSARPLKNAKLPIFSSLLPDIDDLLSAIQGSTVSERIGGTLHKPKMTVILFSDIGQGMKQLLLGDYKSETQGSASQ